MHGDRGQCMGTEDSIGIPRPTLGRGESPPIPMGSSSHVTDHADIVSRQAQSFAFHSQVRC
jgi:hypothetical protein